MAKLDEVARLQILEREINRRQSEERLKFYNNGEKVHRKQMEFHADKSRIRWIFGGNRTGKTVAGAVEAVWYARGNHPFKEIKMPMRGWVVSLTTEVQRDVAQREILKWLNPAWIDKITVRRGEKGDPDNAVIDFITVKSLSGGISTIGFKNCEQGRAKFQGTSQDFIWFDEEPPQEVFEECKMRVIDTCGNIWGTMTPLLGLTWVYEEIYLNSRQNPDIKHWLMEWDDNPYLSKEEIKRLILTMSEEERESRQYGRFTAVSGLVYKEFDEGIHVIDPFKLPKDWYDNISIDPGLQAPLSCHFYACDGDGTVYVIAEHYEAGRNIEYHADKIKKIANELDWKRTRTGQLEALFDSAANQHSLSAERSVAELFKEHGIWAVTTVDKDKWTGIQRVKKFLTLRETQDTERYPKGIPKLFIFRNCPNLIREIKSYRWKQGYDEPIKKDDHALDELRYYIMSRPEPFKEHDEEKPTIIQKHKRKMERNLKKRML